MASRWTRLLRWFKSPKVGDLVRHEGYLYWIDERRGRLAVLRPVADAPWKDVTCLAADLRYGTPDEWQALLQQEAEAVRRVAQNLPDGPRRRRISAFCDDQCVTLHDRFEAVPFWYLPGRVLDRLQLRSLK